MSTEVRHAVRFSHSGPYSSVDQKTWDEFKSASAGVHGARTWDGGFVSGERVDTPSGPGYVTGWHRRWGADRTNLIPVYLPKFPETFFWWFAWGQLTRAPQ